MAKRLVPIGVLILLVTFAASAGDIARFVNLGFSTDSRYFMFGQYGIQEKTSTAWAETYIVAVRANAFVARGVHKVSSSQQVDPGSDGIGALFDAVAESHAQNALYRIHHLATGRMLYVLVDGAPAPDTVDFRDFQTGRNYEIVLSQSLPSGEAGASYALAITVTEKDGTVHTYKAGDPSLRRSGVKAYHIKEIILAPDNASLVFLIQKEEQDSQGNNIRYMIETAGIN
ncbi:MAG: DUF2259 domain-containing protein [Spirochaetia bacterium]|jgi:predicted secreted protein